jgi:hypothetical protein
MKPTPEQVRVLESYNRVMAREALNPRVWCTGCFQRRISLARRIEGGVCSECRRGNVNPGG